MRYQQKQYLFRRLLEFFQQCVGCRAVHGFRRINQDDFETILMSAHVDKVGQLADLLNADLLTGAFFRCNAARFFFTVFFSALLLELASNASGMT